MKRIKIRHADETYTPWLDRWWWPLGLIALVTAGFWLGIAICQVLWPVPY